MSLTVAKNLIRRLRSSGISVYLNPSGCVAFRGLADAPAPLKQELMTHGVALRSQLRVEANLRQARQMMNGKH